MRFNLLKIIVLVSFLLVCSFLIIGSKYYVKSGELFNIFYKKEVALVSNNEINSYNELKQSIKDKYTSEFVKLLNQTSLEFKTGIKSILGDEYILLSEQFNDIINDINAQKKVYEESSEYDNARNMLLKVKQKIDSATEEEKNGYLDEFRSALNEITLLNNKFNNQLKGSRDKIFEIKSKVSNMFKKHKTELLSLRTSQMELCRESIKTMLSNYFLEIKELNQTFNEIQSTTELPFDVNSLQDCLVAGRLETDCYNEILLEKSTENQILSENDNLFKS